jgi:dTDP-glucose 4,6-dehydratase
MTIFVTGGAGFIGSAFVREALKNNCKVVVYDKLTYAGHMENLNLNESVPFIKGCITDSVLVAKTLRAYQVDVVVNFAAESHVDNSLSSPGEFINTNIRGTYTMLSSSLEYYNELPTNKKANFKYVQISTDEVFGALGATGAFTEESPYRPNSPYSASKAAADHLVRAWYFSYKLPTILTNCSNNYGPRQFPEKLIPSTIVKALKGDRLPVYGNGLNVRDWIHVTDHCKGILQAIETGKPGEVYCFGGAAEVANIDVVKKICAYLDVIRPLAQGRAHSELIEFVKDRAGHDFRYAIDDSKARSQLGFKPDFASFEDGLKSTVDWYLANDDWIKSVSNKSSKQNSTKDPV